MKPEAVAPEGAAVAAGQRSSARIRRAVRRDLDRWHGQAKRHGSSSVVDWPLKEADTEAASEGTPQVVRPMPRRPRVLSVDPETFSGPPAVTRVEFKISYPRVFSRMFVWLLSVIYFQAGNLADRLLLRHSLERRARRLRRTFERMGGTLVKIGQQLAVRMDVLPWEYCVELSKMLDRIPEFPVEEAIRAVEEVTRKPLHESFRTFDPRPIGSASVACVYQAELHNGDRVAVKVRRPKVGEQFVADIKALELLLRALEALTILRPGFSSGFVSELRDTLLEELDFFKEVRYQDLFRRRARKLRNPFFSAPKVYFELSGGDVIVQEFVSGVWLSEIFAAVEQHDHKALAYMREQRIDPKVVARRVLGAGYWGLLENLFFHADPHPANIIVQPDNKIIFIDFGSCGSLARSKVNALTRFSYHEKNEDVLGMVHAGMTLLEPLPPVDLDAVMKALEQEFKDALFALRSKHSQWWEKTTAKLWLAFLRVARSFEVPMNRDTLRMIRANLLYDTLAVRLDHDLDYWEEFRRHLQRAGKRSRRRLRNDVRRFVEGGPRLADFGRVEQALDMGHRIVYRIDRFLDRPPWTIHMMVGKWFYAVISIIRTGAAILAFGGLMVLGLTAVNLVEHLTAGRSLMTFEVHLRQAAATIVATTGFQLLFAVLMVVTLRRIVFRLNDKEQ